MPSQYKIDRVEQIGKWFDEADNLLVLRYRGLRVSEVNELRRKLSGMDSDLRVLKNTLTRIALADTPKKELTPLIDGPMAVVFVRRDPGEVARVLKEYSRGRKEFRMMGGWIEGTVLNAEQADAFAALPPKGVLLAQLVSAMQSPLSRLAGNVAGPLRNMVGLLKSYGEKKNDGAGATAEEAGGSVNAAEDAAPGEEEPATAGEAGDAGGEEPRTAAADERAGEETPGEDAAAAGAEPEGVEGTEGPADAGVSPGEA